MAGMRNILKEKDENCTDDALEGITAVVSVKLSEIQFEGQTKSKLGSMEAQGAVSTVFGEALNAFLEENPDDARPIINKALLRPARSYRGLPLRILRCGTGALRV